MTFSTFIPRAPRFHPERSSTIFYPQQRRTDAIFITQNWRSMPNFEDAGQPNRRGGREGESPLVTGCFSWLLTPPAP